jgi:hypothetical protein
VQNDSFETDCRADFHHFARDGRGIGRRSRRSAVHQGAAYIEPIFNWSGFYVGGHIGGAWTNEGWINTANTTAFGDLNPGQGFHQRNSGVFGGG